MAQTFMPYASFQKSAKCLDWRRLGKQRVEAQQILDALLGNPTKAGKVSPWRNRPLTNCWRGYENALRHYINCMIKEWVWRKYNNNMPIHEIEGEIVYPWWVGMPAFHSAHKSILYYKQPEWYSQFNWWESEYPLQECDYSKLLLTKGYQNETTINSA